MRDQALDTFVLRATGGRTDRLQGVVEVMAREMLEEPTSGSSRHVHPEHLADDNGKILREDRASLVDEDEARRAQRLKLPHIGALLAPEFAQVGMMLD